MRYAALLALLVIGAASAPAQTKLSGPEKLVSFAARAIGENRDLAKARAYLQDALALDPNYYPAMYNLGVAYMLDEDWSNAKKWLTAFTEYARSHPNAPRAREELAMVQRLEENDQNPEARRNRQYLSCVYRARILASYSHLIDAFGLIAKAMEIDGQRYEAYAVAGAVCAQASAVTQARALLDAAIERAPADVVLNLRIQRFALDDMELEIGFREKARARLKNGQLDEALKQIDNLAKYGKPDPAVLNDQASVLISMSRFQEARDILKGLTTVNPPSEAARARELLAETDVLERYTKLYTSTSLAHPETGAIQKEIDTLSAGKPNKEKTEKIDELKAKAQSLSKQPRALIAATVALQSEDLDVATVALQIAETAGKSPVLSYRKGLLALKRGKLSDAVKEFGECQAYLLERSFKDRAQVAEACLMAKVPTSAWEIFQASLDVFEKKTASVDLVNAASFAAFGLEAGLLEGDFKSVETLGKKLDAFLEDPRPQYFVGRALLAQNKAGDAVGWLERSIDSKEFKLNGQKLFPKGLAHEWLAKALMANKKPKDAAKAAAEAKALGSTDPEILQLAGGQL